MQIATASHRLAAGQLLFEQNLEPFDFTSRNGGGVAVEALAELAHEVQEEERRVEVQSRALFCSWLEQVTPMVRVGQVAA